MDGPFIVDLFWQALASAIQSVTDVNPDLAVEKIEVKTKPEVKAKPKTKKKPKMQENLAAWDEHPSSSWYGS